MKIKSLVANKNGLGVIITVCAILVLQSGCNESQQKANNAKLEFGRLQDTLTAYLQTMKMEVAASSFMTSGNYDSAISQYKRCLNYLNGALAEKKNKGMSMYGNEIAGIYSKMESVYDSLKEPEKSIECSIESVKWAKTIHDCSMQIKNEINTANELKDLAATTIKDTAKKGKLCREALGYVYSGVHTIDSLRTNDMEDLRYEDYHVTSKIYAVLGDKKQAEIFDKKYKDTYFKIFNKMPVE